MSSLSRPAAEMWSRMAIRIAVRHDSMVDVKMMMTSDLNRTTKQMSSLSRPVAEMWSRMAIRIAARKL
jgi:hypothetical protein